MPLTWMRRHISARQKQRLLLCWLSGDSNKSLAAEFKLPAHLIHRSVMGSTEYQAAMDARRRAEEVADWRMDDMVNDFIVRQTAAHND
jgi:hypothetical protein